MVVKEYLTKREEKKCKKRAKKEEKKEKQIEKSKQFKIIVFSRPNCISAQLCAIL